MAHVPPKSCGRRFKERQCGVGVQPKFCKSVPVGQFEQQVENDLVVGAREKVLEYGYRTLNFSCECVESKSKN